MAENKKDNWEQKTIEKIASNSLIEQRRARRWGIFFKLITLLYIGIIIYGFNSISPTGIPSNEKITALVKLDGVIGSNLEVNADDVIKGLKEAYDHQGTEAVILSINSPGGSPVQSGIINDEIKRYKVTYPDIPIYAVVEDICASGGYYIAVAADQIFVNKASIVGSIGVRMDGFGLEELIKNIGVERRLLTAGKNKGMLDPFLPIVPEQEEFVQNLLNEIHEQFIAVVKEGRGERLANDPQIFSGLFWDGNSAIKLGLVDNLGSIRSVARDIVGNENIIDFTTKASFGERLAEKFGAGIGTSFSSTIINKIKNNTIIK